MKLLGEKIWRLREKRGLSQEEFAELLGVSRQTVSNWENDRATPDAYKLKQLCETLQVSADELLETNAPAISEEPPQQSANAPQEEPKTPEKTRRGGGRTALAVLLSLLAAAFVAVGIVLIAMSYGNTTSSTVIFTPAFGGIALFVLSAALLISALVLFFKRK